MVPSPKWVPGEETDNRDVAMPHSSMSSRWRSACQVGHAAMAEMSRVDGLLDIAGVRKWACTSMSGVWVFTTVLP